MCSPIRNRGEESTCGRSLLVVSLLAPAGLAPPSVSSCLLAAGGRPGRGSVPGAGVRVVPGQPGTAVRRRAGTVVRAAAAGVVSFAGVVAGTRYVVVDHSMEGCGRRTATWRSASWHSATSWRPAPWSAASATAGCTSGCGAATRTSIRRRCSVGWSSGHAWCRRTARPAPGAATAPALRRRRRDR